jgi:lipoate-protein ligase A
MDSALPDSRSRSAPPAGLWLAAGGGDFAAEDVAEALALDEALLEEAHDGVRIEPVVRTWMAQRPVVVVGSSSRVEEEVDVAACRSDGVPILRRPSGGATVILGPGCVMWSVVTPHPAGVPALERIHAAMLDPLVREFATLGLAVSRRGTSDLVLSQPGSSDEAAPEVIKKVSGNALRVRRLGVLYHGTLLDSFDIDLAERLLKHPPREPDYRGRRAHGAFLANLELGRDRLEALVRRAFRATGELAAIPRERVERLVRERYGDATWTHRL